MVKFDSFTTGAARFLSGITGAVSFWTGLARRGVAGVAVVFCLSSGLSGEAGGNIWRSVLTGDVCSALAKGCCKEVSRQEVHQLIDEMFDDYDL